MNKKLFFEEEFPKFSSYRDQAQLKDYLDASNGPVFVHIVQTDEAGPLLWAVMPVDWQQFWLSAYPEKEMAIAFCKRYDFKINHIVEI